MPHFEQSLDLFRGGSERLATYQALQRLHLANGADAARYALTATLLAEENGDSQEDPFKIDTVVKQHDDSRSEHGTNRACALESQRRIEFLWRDESPSRAAQQHGLEHRQDGCKLLGVLEFLVTQDLFYTETAAFPM